MVIFKWTHDLETDIALVDQQHREIIETANRFFLRHKCGKDQKAVEECLSFLQQYILYHFQTEETFQLDCAYPRYREHSAIHSAIATQLKFYAVKIAAAHYSPQSIEQFYVFLTDWLKNHIYSDDLEFARYYKQAQPTRPPAANCN